MKAVLPLLAAGMFAAPALGAFENFDGYANPPGNGSTFGNSGGGSSGGIAWTGAWGEGAAFQSASVFEFNLGTHSTVTSTNPTAEGTAGTIEAIRGFDAQSNTTTWIYFIMAAGKDGGFVTTDSYGGIGLYEGGTEKFLIGQRYQESNWGATASGNLNGQGASSSTAIGNFSAKLFVAKLDQVANELTLWIEPDLTLLESQNTPALTLSYGGNDDDVDSIRLRAGNGGTGNKWQWDNLNVTGSTPFQIPEPASVALFGAGLALMAVRRRQSV